MKFTVCSLLVPVLLSIAGPATAETREVLSFDEPFLWTYGSWEKAVSVENGRTQIASADSKGCGGFNVRQDFSLIQDFSPALDVVIKSANQAKKLAVTFIDEDKKTAKFWFDLEEQPRDVPLQLIAREGSSLQEPYEGDKINPAAITQVQLLGDWQKEAMDLQLDSLSLIKPTAEILTMREARTARLAREAEKKQAELLSAREGIRHTDTSPVVKRIYAVDRNVLAVEMVQGILKPSKLEPYVKASGDNIKGDGEVVEAVQGGKIVEQQINRILQREVNGRLKDVGFIAGGRYDKDDLYLWPFETVGGEVLNVITAQDPESYRVQSAGDANFTNGVLPVAVYRKSKPLNRALPNNEQVVRHIMYLVVPHDLQEGAAYTVDFRYLNTREPSASFTFNPHEVRTEAIHTSQVGYRPDDPYKRAFLSLWMGNKGAYTYDRVKTFELIDGQGKTAFTGEITLALPVDGKEWVRPEKNLSHTAVYAMDFSGFTQPGEYRVYVPGIGVSYPVRISEDAWADAFKLSMHGFLCQRNGIKLGPPFTTFERGRSMHPADGIKVYQSTTTAEAANNKELYPGWFEGLVAGRTDEVLPGAWGGYNDAGDFDRAANHLWATYLHLELLDLFPDYFEKLKLALPPEEAGDNLPDVLNEALWNTELFCRLQKENGGVGAGVESSAHPRRGEDSVTDSLLLMAYAPSPEPSYVYAATAARVSRLIRKYGAGKADIYADSAKRAFDFAEKAKADEGKAYMGVALNDARNVAAAELLMLTGDARYDKAFKETSQWGQSPFIIDAQGGGFTYARLPKGVGDEALKAELVKQIEAQADLALKYGEGNAFGLTTEIKDMPLIGPIGAFTTPGITSRILPRAHFLTHKEKYLAGIIRSCNFSVGANPDNRAFTTGVGFDPPIAPLHFDSRMTGQLPPAGLTVYGAYEPESLPSFAEGNNWVHQWMLPKTMYPSSYTWPSTEFYVDFFMWPLMNEFTIKQNMGPTSYTWGYLAGRSATR